MTQYLTFSGNDIISVRLPEHADVFYALPGLPGSAKRDIPSAVARAFDNPMGMAHLPELLRPDSRVLIAFDDNCQPFPQTPRPDIRQQALEVLLPRLYRCGVTRDRIRLVCAVALHRKMTRRELVRMVGPNIMRDFYPHQLNSNDVEDPDDVADLGKTSEGEIVQVCKGVVDADLVIYVDTVQIPLNGGHKSVAVGLGTYESIANHHDPKMTDQCPHVMQPDGSRMHASIERISRVIMQHTPVMVMEAAMNNATYPLHLRYLGKTRSRCNLAERLLRNATPHALHLLPEPLRRAVLGRVRAAYEPIEINAGAIDPVHERTLALLRKQLAIEALGQYDVAVFGLADLSPYAVGARINPVLVVSDVLGYVFNWFYNKPLVRKGGVIIILNPVFEVFHKLYHVAYQRFYDEVLSQTTDPFQMQSAFQERFARDPSLIESYRYRYAHHGFHPFTVWYWATFALRHLSKVILVGPPNDKTARRLGVSWSPSLDHALGLAKDITGGERIAALTIPPFFYVNVTGSA